MYCNTLACIAEMRAGSVSQYSLVYCDLRAAEGLALYCNTMHSQDRQLCRDTAGWALAWACWARRQALGRGRWGDRRTGASGPAGVSRRAGAGGRAGSRRAGARGAQAGRRQRARQAQAWARGVRGLGARGARPGLACVQAKRAGWSAGPSWCTVHLAQF